jgi:hypothetical protein
MLWSKWSSEEENNKLESKRGKVQEMMRGEKTYPEATCLCFFRRGMPIFCLFILSTGSG